jgi:hypothetical protein
VAPFQLVWAILCAWLHREHEDVIAFLREENRILKARLEGRRLCLEATSVGASRNWAIVWDARC